MVGFVLDIADGNSSTLGEVRVSFRETGCSRVSGSLNQRHRRSYFHIPSLWPECVSSVVATLVFPVRVIHCAALPECSPQDIRQTPATGASGAF
jgi:hypothetical protein